jgi:hypothetical protein
MSKAVGVRNSATKGRVMPVVRLPGGSRGTRIRPSQLARLMTPRMVRIHRRAGDRFEGIPRQDRSPTPGGAPDSPLPANDRRADPRSPASVQPARWLGACGQAAVAQWPQQPLHATVIHPGWTFCSGRNQRACSSQADLERPLHLQIDNIQDLGVGVGARSASG